MSIRFPYLLPALVFLGVAGFLYWGLFLHPRDIPTALKNKPVPSFILPPLDDRGPGFSTADLKTGQVSIVNVFASWCVPCRAEHPQLLALKEKTNISIYGLNYKDSPAQARRFLDELGDPYTRIGADRDGRIGIDWGVYGVPETFVISHTGEIVCKQIGPLTPTDLTNKILPLIGDLQAGKTRTC